jgi:hypothetical protein
LASVHTHESVLPVQDARKELDAAVGELQEKARVVDLLHDKLMGVNNTLTFFDGELQVWSLAWLVVCGGPLSGTSLCQAPSMVALESETSRTAVTSPYNALQTQSSA